MREQSTMERDTNVRYWPPGRYKKTSIITDGFMFYKIKTEDGRDISKALCVWPEVIRKVKDKNRVYLCWGRGCDLWDKAKELAKIYLGPQPDGTRLRFKDGNPEHCWADNLFWGPYAENCSYTTYDKSRKKWRIGPNKLGMPRKSFPTKEAAMAFVAQWDKSASATDDNTSAPSHLEDEEELEEPWIPTAENIDDIVVSCEEDRKFEINEIVCARSHENYLKANKDGYLVPYHGTMSLAELEATKTTHRITAEDVREAVRVIYQAEEELRKPDIREVCEAMLKRVGRKPLLEL